MELMPEELENILPALYSTRGIDPEDKIAQVKFHCEAIGWIWYGVEYDPVTKEFYGLICGCVNEWGFFSLIEFEEINASHNFHVIQLDKDFKPTKIKCLNLDLDT